jgi:hypothetical protein
VVIVQLLDLHFPVDPILGAVLDRDGQVASVVEPSELRGRDQSLGESACFGLLRLGPIFGLVQTCGFAPETLSLLEDG